MVPIRARAYNSAFLLCAFAVLVFAMFPGRFDGDAIWQYRGSLQFAFDDSHSVMDAALIGMLSDFGKGPGPMFVLQLALWIAGLLVLTDTLIASGRPVVGQAISLLALTPLLSFDFFDVQKDALFSGLLAVLVGLGVRRVLQRRGFTLIGAFAAFWVFMLALDTRQNAFFALIPLWLLAQPVRSLAWRPILITLATGAVAFTAAYQADRWIDHDVLRTNRSPLIYALALYDLAGITARTGKDASQGLIADFPANVARCYSVKRWDDFLGGPCQTVGLTTQAKVVDGAFRKRLIGQWVKEIALHPIAYAAHRARNFGCLVRVGCYDDQLMSSGWAPRPWDDSNVRVTASAQVIGAAAAYLWRGLLADGWLWILVLAGELALGAVLLRQRGYEPLAYLALALSTAGLFYLLSFAVAGVADQLRYLHPAIFLATLGAPLAAAAAWRAWRPAAARAAAGGRVARLWLGAGPPWPAKWAGFRPIALRRRVSERDVRS